MKYEWRKAAKQIYIPKKRPELITVPAFRFFVLDGKGNPNDEAFSEAIGVLYSLSYAIKMMPKQGIVPEGYYDYTVFPLEGIWDMEQAGEPGALDKDNLIYRIMIRQPDFVTEEVAEEVLRIVGKKKPHPLLDSALFTSIEDGLSVQMLHIGPYDEEAASFAEMDEYCENHQLRRTSQVHREIYLSDPRRTQPEKLKTVLRYHVEYV
ncbi:MAG: GyrI-like domain-containing protein [Bacillus sp. (in: firmicutes)]